MIKSLGFVTVMVTLMHLPCTVKAATDVCVETHEEMEGQQNFKKEKKKRQQAGFDLGK